MGYVIDFIIVVVAVTAIMNAWKKGFIMSVSKLVTGIVSFIAAYAFTPAAAEYIYDKFALKTLSGGIAKTIGSLSRTDAGKFDLSAMFSDMPDALKQIIERYSVDQGKLGKMCAGVTAGSEETVNKLSEYIAAPIAETISSAVAFIGLFLIALVVMNLAVFLIDTIFKLPVLNSTNKMLGLLFGVGEALIFAVIISSVSAAVLTALGSVDPVTFGAHVVERSYIMKTLSSIDLFGLL